MKNKEKKRMRRPVQEGQHSYNWSFKKIKQQRQNRGEKITQEKFLQLKDTNGVKL